MSDLADFSTAAIALLALGVSLHQIRKTDRQQRLSVRPHLSFTRVSGDRSFKITLSNVGLGPAQVMSFTFSANGAERVIGSSNDIEPLLKSAGINSCKIDWLAHTTPGDFIPVGKELVVLKISNVVPYELSKHIMENYETLNVHVRYQSLYGDSYYSDANLVTRIA